MKQNNFIDGNFVWDIGRSIWRIRGTRIRKVDRSRCCSNFRNGRKIPNVPCPFLIGVGKYTAIGRKKQKPIFYLIVAGILLFSFSIYLLATNALTNFDFKVIGFLTPIGGGVLILGWAILGYGLYSPLKGMSE